MSLSSSSSTSLYPPPPVKYPPAAPRQLVCHTLTSWARHARKGTLTNVALLDLAVATLGVEGLAGRHEFPAREGTMNGVRIQRARYGALCTVCRGGRERDAGRKKLVNTCWYRRPRAPARPPTKGGRRARPQARVRSPPLPTRSPPTAACATCTLFMCSLFVFDSFFFSFVVHSGSRTTATS